MGVRDEFNFKCIYCIWFIWLRDSFIILGYIVEKFRIGVYKKNNIVNHIVYFTLLGYAVYYPRTDFLMQSRSS